MSLESCHNFKDFRKLAKRRLPAPVFHYIDGAADDELTKARNTSAFDDVDLVPNVLAGVEDVDLSTTLFGKKLSMPLYCSPVAIQRLFHHEGERAVAKAAAKHETMFGISSLSTVSVEEIEKLVDTPKMFQFYFHKDRGLNDNLLERAKAAKFDVLALTVDTITGGNRERDLRTGFTIPPRLTFASMLSFATHPMWGINYLTKPKFRLPHLEEYVSEGTNVNTSIGQYFSTMLDQSMNWNDAERLCAKWGGHFALKGIMSVDDAKKAVDIGCSGIMVSNHGGRQLDGGRAPFDQLAEIVDAVGDKVEVICEGGIQRGTHVLKALSIGAKACAGGRLYLYALAAAGQAGVERALNQYRSELERDMKLMGYNSVDQLRRSNLRFR
ncbi:MAG: alpha-hydroxy-acid oxidizing enzyme [Gammaproteobacteria bacterium]|nr:alpha-hydroxy-acid oxidizing enzyme [Gammaproteobacteria bacterium]|tara:strand:+ start:119 stop:1267 length:1149 start_codon:yes stop_codon:yes gene_type:complete